MKKQNLNTWGNGQSDCNKFEAEVAVSLARRYGYSNDKKVIYFNFDMGNSLKINNKLCILYI